jgi:O-antigen ligase
LSIGLEAGLDATALLFFPLLVLAPLGIAVLASVAGLLAGLRVVSENPARVRALLVPAMLLGALFCWAALSALWSIDPLRSLEIALRLAGLFAAALALILGAELVAAPRRLALLLLVGLGLGLAMAQTELATGGLLSAPLVDARFRDTQLNRASVLFAVLLPPAVALLLRRGRRPAALLCTAATLWTVWTLAGTAAKALLPAGAAMAVLVWVWPARAARIAGAISVLVIVTAPLTFARIDRLPSLTERADAVKVSAGHRLMIWSFVGDRIAERPLLGWGLDSSRAIPGGRDPIRPGETWLPLHPHNAALQLWLELGAPGAALAALIVAGLWRGLARARWPRPFAAGAGASLAAATVACLGTYGIWQEWWLGALMLSLFFVLVMARAAAKVGRAPRPGPE